MTIVLGGISRVFGDAMPRQERTILELDFNRLADGLLKETNCKRVSVASVVDKITYAA